MKVHLDILIRIILCLFFFLQGFEGGSTTFLGTLSDERVEVVPKIGNIEVTGEIFGRVSSVYRHLHQYFSYIKTMRLIWGR